MNTDFQRRTGETDKEYFTRVAKLIYELKIAGKKDEAAEGFKEVCNELVPILEQVIDCESIRNRLDEDTKLDYAERVYAVISKIFYRYNNPVFMKEKDAGKQFEIKTFIKSRTQYCMRNAIAHSLGIAHDRARTLLRIRSVRETIARDLEVSEDKVTAEMLYERLESTVALEEIVDLLRVEKGHLSLDVLPETSDFSEEQYEIGLEVYGTDLDDSCKAPLDEAMDRLSDLDVYLLMKEFGLLSEKENAMEMCDFIITPTFQKLFDRDETIRSRENPLRTAYNKNAKVMKVLAELNGRLNMCDVEGCLVGYFCERWNQILNR